MRTTYYSREFRHWGRKRRVTKSATLMCQVGDSNWRECDVECINGVYTERQRGSERQVKIVNIRGLEHIGEKWVDETTLRWWDAALGKFVYRGFFEQGEES